MLLFVGYLGLVVFDELGGVICICVVIMVFMGVLVDVVIIGEVIFIDFCVDGMVEVCSVIDWVVYFKVVVCVGCEIVCLVCSVGLLLLVCFVVYVWLIFDVKVVVLV